MKSDTRVDILSNTVQDFAYFNLHLIHNCEYFNFCVYNIIYQKRYIEITFRYFFLQSQINKIDYEKSNENILIVSTQFNNGTFLQVPKKNILATINKERNRCKSPSKLQHFLQRAPTHTPRDIKPVRDKE